MADKPVKEFRAGLVRAAVWANKRRKDGREFTAFSVTLERRYRDAAGAWKSTASFGENDLPKAALVVQRAFEALVAREATARGGLRAPS